MIKVNWNGRLGNQLFEYAIGRILAEELGYALVSPALPGFSATKDNVFGKVLPAQISLHGLPGGQTLDWNLIEQHRDKFGFSIDGWFQRYEYYQPHRKKIRSWFNRDRVPGPIVLSDDDIVVHIRRTEQTYLDTKMQYAAVSNTELKINDDIVRCSPHYNWKSGDIIQANGDLLPWEFYRDILDNAVFNRVVIVTNCPNDPFLQYFEKYNHVIVCVGVLQDFNTVRSARRIIMSISTFSWWAAYLSDAEEIYMPVPNYELWGGPKTSVDLKVTDEFRYCLVPVVRNGKTFF